MKIIGIIGIAITMLSFCALDGESIIPYFTAFIGIAMAGISILDYVANHYEE